MLGATSETCTVRCKFYRRKKVALFCAIHGAKSFSYKEINSLELYGHKRYYISTGGFMAVNLKADIKPISYIKTNAADMMKYINENKNPIIITQNGEAKAVLIDVESYQDMQNAFSLMGIIKEAEIEIERGDYKESDTVFAELKKRVKSK